MRSYRKLACVFCLVTLLLGLAPGFSAAQSPTALLTPAAQIIPVGGTATVVLRAQDVVNLNGYRASLAFDPAVLEVVDADPALPGVQITLLNTFINPQMLMGNEANNSLGMIVAMAMQMSASPVSGSGDLVSITFRGKALGVSEVGFAPDFSLFDGSGNPITATLTIAEITVADPMPTPTVVPPTATPIPTPAPPPTSTMGTLLKGIVSDVQRNRLYVAVQSDNTVAVLDGTAYNNVLASVPCGGLGPNGLALSPDGSKLFVVNGGSDHVAVLDANTYALITTIPVGRRPFGIAIGGNVAYVTNFDDGTVTLFNVNTLAVQETFWVGHHPGLPAALGDHAYIPIHSEFSRWDARDGQAERAFVESRKGSDTGVVILYGDGRPNPVVRVLEQYVGFFAAAVDSTNGRVYISKRDGTAEGVYVLDTTNHNLLQFIPMLRPYVIGVNPTTQHIFVVQADMDEVYVLDAANGHRMIRAQNTDPNNGDIEGMHGGQGITLHRSAIIATNYAAGTLAVLDYGTSPGFAVPMDVEYIRGWQEAGGNHGTLGAPVAPSSSYWYSEQQYERGLMNWRGSGVVDPTHIYVFDIESTRPGGTDWMGRDNGIWTLHNNAWLGGMPLFPAACPDAWWPYGPMFGFGVAWCNESTTRGTIKSVIGYPIGWEYGAMGGDQQFAYGKVFWNAASDAYYVLWNSPQQWQYYRAHRRYEDNLITPNVTGRISLPGRADRRGVILSSLAGPHTTTDENGRFGLYYEGQMELHIRYPGCLEAVVTVKAGSGASLDLGEMALVGGDLNGDNRIDILDLSYIGYRFATADAGADLNGDGVVNILDLTLVGGHFGQTGPVRWNR